MRRRSLARAFGLLLSVSSAAGCRFSEIRFSNQESEEKTVPAAGDQADDTRPIELTFRDEPVIRVVSGSVTCTGTLIYQNQVLTAHHCVSERDNQGRVLHKDVRPETVTVELGGDYLPWGVVGVKAVVAPSCGHAAGYGDIAILVLEQNLSHTSAVTPRLDSPPEVGEEIRPVGFGRCSADGIRRRQRAAGAIEQVESDRFKLSASICPGDSGGPALSVKRGDIVGVVSASVMDADERTSGRSEFTRLDQWRSVFAAAKLIADGAEAAEVPPVDCPKQGSSRLGTP